MAELHQVTIDTSNDAPQPTLEELAAKMDADNAASSEQAPLSSEDRPEWLPEKFKSVEDMAAAYKELESKLGKKVEPDTNTDDEEAPKEGDEASEQEQAKEAVEKAGLNLEDLSNKYFEQGDLDASDYEALDKAGYPKHLVDQFIAGQNAIATQIENNVFNAVGGKEEYDTMLSWATEDLTPGEIKAYNKAVNSSDVDEVLGAVKGLKARYNASVGFEPTRQVKAESNGATASTYRSVAEMQKDMADPRYKTDSAFRKDVEQRLGRSNIF